MYGELSNRNLVITRAGPSSLHTKWIEGEKRNFDLLVAFYSSDHTPLEKVPNVSVIYLPGKKVQGWNELFSQNPHLLDKYDNIALLDDDLLVSSDSISDCFDLGLEYKLSIWQPSLTWKSHTTYAGFLTNPFFKLRFVNYIEMMCPFFSTKYLKNVLPLFSLGYESGIDLVWCSLGDKRNEQFAIIDSIQVVHTRPVGIAKEQNGFVNRGYETDINMCLERFSLRWPSLVSSSAVLRFGGVRLSQFLISAASFVYLGSLTLAPKRGLETPRFKAVLDHIRHQFTRRPNFHEISDIVI